MALIFKPMDAESQHKDAVLAFSYSMFKVGELMTTIKQALQEKGLEQLRSMLSNRGGIPGGLDEWYRGGVDCDFLKPGTEGWKKGKIRIKITLEFCSSELEIVETKISEVSNSNQLGNSTIESPLEDIRRMINQDS